MTTPSSAAGKIPATVVTGFLGSGKTTIIRTLLEKANGKRIALIVNEFGDLGFDGDELAHCADPSCKPDEVIELTNGCICCTVADDFLPTIETLLAREPAPEHIVIETSGLALPQPLVQAFQWPAIRNRVTVDGVVTVVDADAVSAGRVAHDEDAVDAQRKQDESLDHESAIEELFEDQLKCADIVLINKMDLIAEDGLAAVEARIRPDMRKNAKTIAVANGDAPITAIFGLDAGAEDDMHDRRSHHDMEGHEEHDHDEFVSWVTDGVSAASLADLKQRVEAVMDNPDVYRVKGLAPIDGKDALGLVQAVGPRVEVRFTPADGRKPGLVVIGDHDLDQEAVSAQLRG